jgi:outer membrane protein OmpA-like peptidoglycan-associated protein
LELAKIADVHDPPISPFAVTLVIACGALAQDAPQDAENCKDSTLITRMPGSTIHSCEHKEFEQFQVRTGTNEDGEAIGKQLEGEYWSWDYGNREGVSGIQYFETSRPLSKAGFAIDRSGSPIHTVKEMQQEVTAHASHLRDEISKSGHVAVYGIHFETGKAAILPDSEPMLAELQKLLEQNDSLKIRIEGHTDNVGQKAANQALSERRAQAVPGWLTAHGIDAFRLGSKGFGVARPVADNSNEEGRGKHRRVELAKM